MLSFMLSQGMAAMSQNCRISEKHKYWKEFQSNGHQFFKIMIGDFRNHLRIPRKFMSNFRENLSETIHLRGPSGFMWTVELVRMFDDVVFRNGWEIFVKEHRLAVADLLVFRYDGNSTFNVLIFDPSGCEREGSYFVKKHMKACSSGRCVFRKEDGKDYEEVIDLDKIHENNLQKEKINKGKGRPSSKAAETFYNRCHLKATEKKQPRVGNYAREEIEVVMDESDETSGCAMEASEDWGNKSVSLKFESERPEGKMQRPVDLQGTYNLYFISNRRELTEEEKQRPCKLARQYSSTRPSFSIIMKPSHVYRAFTVTIPKRWQAMDIFDGVRRAELRVPPGEIRWPVRITSSKWRKGFTRGWAKFVKDNNLEEHDACVFELNEERKANGKIIFFNVIIFRALDEIVTLTQFSRAK